MATKDGPNKPSTATDEDDGWEDLPQPSTTAGHLAFNDNFARRRAGGDGGPEVGDMLDALEDGPIQEPAELLPGARIRYPDLPEPEMRPPMFLKPLEAMKDIYMKVKGRMSRRTTELLEGVDLEDLIDELNALHDDEVLVRHSEARVIRAISDHYRNAESPLMIGLSDPRLTELWRLFLDGWEIWVPDGEELGVELFWEGEAEDDGGSAIEILQSIARVDGEITLTTRWAEHEDRLVFDGEAFYRLKTEKRQAPKE